MNMDFNDAEPQRDFSPMPVGTLVKVYLQIRPGSVGDGGMLTQSRSSDAQYLSGELTVTCGPFKNRKIWQNFTVSGGKVNEQGQSIAAGITRSTIRAMLNSASNVRPDDDSDRARQARTISSYRDLDGLEFAAKLGIQKGNDGFQDRNTIAAVIEPDHKDYTAIMSGDGVVAAVGGSAQSFAGGSSKAAGPAQRAPEAAWAKPAQAQTAAPEQPSQPTGSGSSLPSWAG